MVVCCLRRSKSATWAARVCSACSHGVTRREGRE
jgi:hypothetical protein